MKPALYCAVLLSRFYALDINECEEDISGCAESCKNTNGSFTCDCTTPGYVIAPDGLNCTGLKTYYKTFDNMYYAITQIMMSAGVMN